MKKNRLIIYVVSLLYFSFPLLYAQRGYFDAPYKRYEADKGALVNASITTKSYKQSDLQSEATDQICVNMTSANASVEWASVEAADGLVIRYSIPDNESGSLGVYVNNVKVSTLSLTTTWSWEYLATNGNPNNTAVVNTNPKMRFDEVRVKLSSKIPLGGKLKLVREAGNISVDFVELEPIPTALVAPTGAITYIGNGNTLQTVIDANPGKTIFLPAGTYNVNRKLWFGADNTKLMGAGMWHTQINFTFYSTSGVTNEGGLYADAVNISFSDLYLTTVRNSRSNSYKAINGVYTSGSIIENVWAEHFEAGAWIAQYYYSSTPFTDGLVIRNCRFRNNYADGINLCKGTRNTVVEHCSFRNNGDDDMAIWSADGLECQNNIFRFNTSENCWRASGCAIYGGYNNKAQNLYIKDNLEVGLRVNNSFSGIAFNNIGMHEFSDITIDGCGTFNDLYNKPVGAIDVVCDKKAGLQVNNVKFSKIDILNSKNDAIYINKVAGDGIYNLIIENVTVSGTGKEYPNNNSTNSTQLRGYGLHIDNSPAGNGTYCGISYSNRGGNATSDVDVSGKGSFAWTANTACITTIGSDFADDNRNPIVACKNSIMLSRLTIGDQLTVYNMFGVKVFSTEATQNTESIAALRPGFYLVTVNGNKRVKKLYISAQ